MLEKIVMEVESELKDLYLKYPNWYELGKEVRKLFGNNEITKLYPNDYDLGSEVSKIFIKK
jgi:hypothetical protein